MAEKILNTRIALKYDTLANWSTSTLVLKTGEIAIAEIPSNPMMVQTLKNQLMHRNTIGSHF